MKTSAEELAIEVVRKLQSAGHVAYFAGGCVRDGLMGREPKDFDVATSAVPDVVLRLFPYTQMVGAAFGVALVKRGKAQVEVATFRSEGVYTDGRRPDSVTFTTAVNDAKRRDFTCNGIFFDPVTGVLHDFVGGRADIEKKLLRAIGDPNHRFAEDHLRMMRAVRFAAKLGFTIEPATMNAIEESVDKIGVISRERVGEELRMMLEHELRIIAVRLLGETGLLGRIWPRELLGSQFDAQRFLGAPGNLSRAAGIAAMQFGFGMQGIDSHIAANLLQAAFVLSNDETAEIAWLLRGSLQIHAIVELSKSKLKRMLGSDYFKTLWQIWESQLDRAWVEKAAARIVAMENEGVAPAAFVTGDDLIKLGAKPGRNFKQWLETLYDRQLELEFPAREDALAAARKLIAQG